MQKYLGPSVRNGFWTVVSSVAVSILLCGNVAHADSSVGLEALLPSSGNSTVQADQKIQNVSNQTDDLELNNEVENLQQYGDAAEAQTAKTETAKLERENKQLQHQAIVLKYRRKHSQALVKRLQKIYQRHLIAVVLARKKVAIAARAAQLETRRVDQLRARIDFKNTLLARERSRELRELHRMEFMKRANYRLRVQLAKIKRYLKWHHKRYEELHAKSNRLSRVHRDLYRKFVRARYAER